MVKEFNCEICGIPKSRHPYEGHPFTRKMEKEFNLSSKRDKINGGINYFYWEKNIKEFIKIIDGYIELIEFKFGGTIEKCDNPQKLKDAILDDINELRKKIKKRAGEKLC